MTNLDANAIREIERLTLSASPVVRVPGEAQGVYYLRQGDGTLVRHQAALDPVHTIAFDLASFQAQADALHEAGVLKAVYLADGGVVALADNGIQRWQVGLSLPTHPASDLLRSWRMPAEYTQKELVRLLRTELVDYVLPHVIADFQHLKITDNKEGDSVQKPMNASFDTKIVRSVQTAEGAAAPEHIAFRAPIYDIPELRSARYPFMVYVEFDHDKKKFVLLTVHTQLREAQEQAIATVQSSLTEGADGRYPVYYGARVDGSHR